MPGGLERNILGSLQVTRQAHLLTIENNPHIPNEVMDYLDNLQCGHLSLLLGESIESL